MRKSITCAIGYWLFVAGYSKVASRRKYRQSKCHNKLTLEKFQATKRKERASSFRPKGNARKRQKTQDDTSEEVVINIGIMFYNGDQLKPQRSKNLSVTASPKDFDET